MAKTIGRFEGMNKFLSNFWLCDLFIIPPHLDCGEVCHAISLEHAFQAMKATNIYDFYAVLDCSTPGKAKQKGREIKLRADWDNVKDSIMKELLHVKFKDTDLRSRLLLTGDAELIEGNWWKDTYWGVCAGIGQNKLGKLLMEERDEIRNKSNSFK
jgi:ribA/ribD-fused uncharacterized protein